MQYERIDDRDRYYLVGLVSRTLVRGQSMPVRMRERLRHLLDQLSGTDTTLIVERHAPSKTNIEGNDDG